MTITCKVSRISYNLSDINCYVTKRNGSNYKSKVLIQTGRFKKFFRLLKDVQQFIISLQNNATIYLSATD